MKHSTASRLHKRDWKFYVALSEYCVEVTPVRILTLLCSVFLAENCCTVRD